MPDNGQAYTCVIVPVIDSNNGIVAVSTYNTL